LFFFFFSRADVARRHVSLVVTGSTIQTFSSLAPGELGTGTVVGQGFADQDPLKFFTRI
jgi:hypothetical protein